MTTSGCAVVIPTLDEAGKIAATVAAAHGLGDEVVVVDGGSVDDTVALARAAGARVIAANRGRARQMNAGARATRAPVLVFLHADCRPPAGSRELIAAAIEGGAAWGRFDVALAPSTPVLAVVAIAMNLRSHWTGIVTGDQALFARRAAFDAVGGFPEIALMEDIALSQRLRARFGRPIRIRAAVTADSRRWHRHGVWRTIAAMWWLRLRYWAGADPDRLHDRYYDQRSRDRRS